MQQETTDFTVALAPLSEDLLYGTAIDIEFKQFVWGAALNDELTIERLLSDIGYFSPLEVADLFSCLSRFHRYQFEQVQQRYQQLIETLRLHLIALEVYGFIPRNPYSDQSKASLGHTVPIFIGRVNEKQWIGLMPKLRQIVIDSTSAEGSVMEEAFVSDEFITFLAQLRNLANGLCHSAWDYDFDIDCNWEIVFVADRATTIEKLLSCAGYLARVEIEVEVFGDQVVDEDSLEEHEDFFRQEWVWKQELVGFLSTHLQSLRTYLIGGARYCDRYVIGQLQNGDWAGVTTYGRS